MNNEPRRQQLPDDCVVVLKTGLEAFGNDVKASRERAEQAEQQFAAASEILKTQAIGLCRLNDELARLRTELAATRAALFALADSQENNFLCWCSDGDEHIAASTDPTEHAVICNRARAAMAPRP